MVSLLLFLSFHFANTAHAAPAQNCIKALDFTEHGFYRVATKSPQVAIGYPMENARRHLEAINEAVRERAHIILFPEMSLTGYTIEDPVKNETILRQTREALAWLAKQAKDLPITIIAGGPYRLNGHVYNSAFVLQGGKIKGAIPKSKLPNSIEFYDERWYASGEHVDVKLNDSLLGAFRVSRRQLFRLGDLLFGVEICEDVFSDQPPSLFHARAGANVVFNLSASNELVGKSDDRQHLIEQRSTDYNLGYVYASAGPSESSKDVIYSGHNLIVENGKTLTQLRPLDPARDDAYPTNKFEGKLLVHDIDVQRLNFKKSQNMTNKNARLPKGYREVSLAEKATPLTDSKRDVDPTPFIPKKPGEIEARSKEIIRMQAYGVANTARAARVKKLVIGISGGSDSTEALLVCLEAVKILGWSPADIIGVTMPGFGTIKESHQLALDLMKELGVTIRDIPIVNTVLEHFKDLNHDPNREDIVFQNAQARYRTFLLFQISNEVSGLVIGTGDLSESWLGYTTLNADQTAGYNPNGGVPKTLIRFLIKAYADFIATPAAKTLLYASHNLDASAELLRPVAGKVVQKSEKDLGPYEVHDFYMYHMLGDGAGPRKLLAMAEIAFQGIYSPEDLKRWLRDVYLPRGYGSQYKRNTNPAGLMIGIISLSPRGAWRQPTELDWRGFIDELDELDAADRQSPRE